MLRLGSRDHVRDKDRLCMYKVMVDEKVNMNEVIFFYLLQAFKDRFHAKGKKNLVPYKILLTQITRNKRVDVSMLEPSVGATQLKGVTFVKMGIVDKFLEYAQKHIKRKVKKELRRNHNLWLDKQKELKSSQ